MSELKLCPFCGGEATDYGSFVQCENEDCEVNPHAETVAAWNTRVVDEFENGYAQAIHDGGSLFRERTRKKTGTRNDKTEKHLC